MVAGMVLAVGAAVRSANEPTKQYQPPGEPEVMRSVPGAVATGYLHYIKVDHS